MPARPSEATPGYARAGAGPPVVLLHGLGGTWRVWLPLLPLLGAQCAVFAPTLPGHVGAAPQRCDRPITAERLLDALEAQLDSAGIGAAHLVGNSLGGALALALALRGRALSVAAIAPAGLLSAAEAARLAARLRANRAFARLIRRPAHALVRLAWGRRTLLRSAVHRGEALPAAQARQWIDALIDCPAFDAILQGVAGAAERHVPADPGCAVTLIWPEDDRILPPAAYAQRFRQALPRARHLRLPAAGHVPMWDAPEPLAAWLLAHVGRAEEARKEGLLF